MSRRVDFVANFAHREHPNLEGRKEVAAKALAALHFDMLPPSGPLTELLETVELRARQEAPHNDNSFTAFLDDLNLVVAEQVARRARPGFSKAATLFKRDSELITCEKCTSGKKCTGSPLDDPAIVAVSARCLSTITRMFLALVDLANKFYDDVLPSSPKNLTITFKTTITRHDGLGGETRFPSSDAAEAREAAVTATLPIGVVERPYFARLPYLLFHEIFVHCTEAWRASGRRVETEETCAFREGFVDAAAVHVLSRSLSSREIALTDYPELNDSFAQEAKAAHFERTSRSLSVAAGRDLAPILSLRHRGASLFNRFDGLTYGSFAERLAAALNCLDSTPELRGAYLSFLEDIADQLSLSPEERSARGGSLLLTTIELLHSHPVDIGALEEIVRSICAVDNLDF